MEARLGHLQNRRVVEVGNNTWRSSHLPPRCSPAADCSSSYVSKISRDRDSIISLGNLFYCSVDLMVTLWGEKEIKNKKPRASGWKSYLSSICISCLPVCAQGLTGLFLRSCFPVPGQHMRFLLPMYGNWHFSLLNFMGLLFAVSLACQNFFEWCIDHASQVCITCKTSQASYSSFIEVMDEDVQWWQMNDDISSICPLGHCERQHWKQYAFFIGKKISKVREPKCVGRVDPPEWAAQTHYMPVCPSCLLESPKGTTGEPSISENWWRGLH